MAVHQHFYAIVTNEYGHAQECIMAKLMTLFKPSFSLISFQKLKS